MVLTLHTAAMTTRTGLQRLLITRITLKSEQTGRRCSATQQRIDGAKHTRQQPIRVVAYQQRLVLMKNRIQRHDAPPPGSIARPTDSRRPVRLAVFLG